MRTVIGSCLLLLSGLGFCQEMVREVTYSLVNTYPHNINSFTQGLIYNEGFLFEGTGKNGLSTLS